MRTAIINNKYITTHTDCLWSVAKILTSSDGLV